MNGFDQFVLGTEIQTATRIQPSQINAIKFNL